MVEPRASRSPDSVAGAAGAGVRAHPAGGARPRRSTPGRSRGAARAQAAVEHGAETMPDGLSPRSARLLLRAEGVASSFIEGVTAPVVDIVLAEADESGDPSAAAWVAANLAAVTEAIEEAHAGPLTVESLCRWHRTLMTGSPTPAQHVGRASHRAGVDRRDVAARRPPRHAAARGGARRCSTTSSPTSTATTSTR